MMSLIGSSVVVLTGGDQWRLAVIRAASQALHKYSDLAQIRVLLEWSDYATGGGDCQDEWVNLGKPDQFKSVYVEQSLLWAKRVLPSEQNRAVAWPARAFVFLCGSPVLSSPDVLIVEYFCDKEKVQLFMHETKELQLAEAKATLSQQPQLLQELHEWEELAQGRDLLHKCCSSLKGHRVSVYNLQLHKSWITGVVVSVNCQNKELAVREDRSQVMHTVNPHMIHVMLHSAQEEGHGLSVPSGQWSTPPLSLVNSPDVPPTNGSPGLPPIKSPHLTSPVIQECPSPLFNLNSSSKSSLYHSNSNSTKDISTSIHNGVTGPYLSDSTARRSSLQPMNLSLIRSEPNISRRCSLDPVTLKRLSEPFGFSQDLPSMQSYSLGRIPFHSNANGGNTAPTTPSNVGGLDGRGFQQQQQQPHPLQSSCSPHGSNSHLSMHGSNPQLSSLHGSNSSLCGGMGGDDMNLPPMGSDGSGYYPTPEDIIKQTDRSQSMGNIYGSVQNQLINQYHHHHHQPLQRQHHQQQQQQGISGNMIPGNIHPPQQHGGPVINNNSQAPPPPSQGLATGQRRSSDSPLQTCQKRKQAGFPAGGPSKVVKKPRFVMSPEVSKSGDGLTGSLNLSRSVSQPAVFPSKTLEQKLKQLTGGVGMFGGGDSQQKHEDDLDIIKQIIETDESVHTTRQPGGGDSLKGAGKGSDGGGDGSLALRSQSLTHIHNQFSYAGSLPSLHHTESMHVLHANYNSAPDLPQFGKPQQQQQEQHLLSPGHQTGMLGAPPMSYGEDSYGTSVNRNFSSNDRMLSSMQQQQQQQQRRPRQSLESVYEEQSIIGNTSSSASFTSGTAGGNPQARASIDLGHGQPPQQQSQLQQHRHSYGGGRTNRDGCHPIAMTRSASLSTNTYSSDFSLVPSDHTLSNSNPSLGPESTRSVVNHYPSDENIHTASLAPDHSLTQQQHGSALPPSTTPSSVGGLVGGVSGVVQGVSSSAGMENILGQYLGDGSDGGRSRSYSEVERPMDIVQMDGDPSMSFSGANRRTSAAKDPIHPPAVATEATVLSAGENPESLINGEDVGEYSISKVINTQFSGTEDMEDDDLLYSPDDPKYSSEPGSSELMASFSSSAVNSLASTPSNLVPGSSDSTSNGKKVRRTKKPKKIPPPKENPRSRGRPRLSEEEKQRRKELRELGLLKRSRRRTKEEVAQWKAEKVLTPAKRGRKPGSGKKNIIKAASGKVVYVTVDLSKFTPGTILQQNGFCRAYPGVSKCLDCGTCEGDLPNSKYCRFLEFRKLLIESSTDPRVSVYGFSDYTDVTAPDLVNWTPLKTNFSKMEETTALFILHKIAQNFITVATEQAKTLPVNDVLPLWKRPVSGIRELCDTCDTSLFNFHWVCKSCGFCICPACYDHACNSEDDLNAVSSMQTSGWPVCVSDGQPHQPTSLLLAQIIPANVLSEVIVQVLAICKHYKIQMKVPAVVQRLISTVSRQLPQTKYQNEAGKKSRGQPTTVLHTHQGTPPQLAPPSDTPPHPLLSSHLTHPHHHHQQLHQPPLTSSSPTSTANSTKVTSIPTSIPLSLLPPNCTSLEMPPIELPHSCSNGNEDLPEAEPFSCPHQWLCDGTLLCLLDAKHNENIIAFQERWRRSEPVLVCGVDNYLDKELWTPQAFSKEFGEEPADLVDCRMGLHLLQLPSKTFWDGFENMNVRLRDPTKNEPRLLKLKDWPTGDDFSVKLPKRFNDLMDALPLPDYTRRDGKYNMASSLPKFFVRPDLGPKMYNAYGSPQYPQDGTTNLHLDISSAVNVMVYCNIPSTVAAREWELIEDTVRNECCPQSLHRIQHNKAKPGAMWQIYSPGDVDKIRAFLRKVYEEKGFRVMPGNDPIHDQLIYLDSELRERMLQEYGVKGWTIIQCVGDAVFIPAGAPHQVRNLCNCIKVAEDFVSPEHVDQCLKLTEEFRHLSDHHANHEDKLQVKNILYHSMKDIVGALKSSVR